MKKVLIFLLFLTTGLVCSQSVENKEDIKVGLVLSGGGAKGFAHVAVLKVLEEAGIRVDYIAGTSMGAIVGSLYAAGYNSTELDSILRNVDFEKIMNDDIPRKSKPFYEKQNGENHALVLPIKNKKIELPMALSNGQNVLNLLSELLHHVDTISNFKDLPIPFVCVTTDIETGEKVILKDGFLPLAVQASGAFPTLLTPVEIDGRLLVDGGIVNNFPVDEIEKMNPDIIIGVDLGTDYDTREELNSILNILNQIISFKIYDNYEEQRAKTDVLIHPNMNDYNVTSFDQYKEIYTLGENSAREHFGELVKIGNRQSKKRIHTPIKPFAEEMFVREIKISGNKDYTKTYVKAKMQIDDGQAITHDQFIEGVNNLTATGNFSSIQYQIKDTEDGNVIRLKLKQDPVEASVKLAVHYDHLYKTSFLVNFTAKHALFKNDIVSADLILGDNVRYNFDYYIDNVSNWSVGFKSRYSTFNVNVDFDWIDSEINQIALEYRDFTNLLYLQTVLNRKFALGVGVEHKNIRAFTKTFLNPSSASDEDKNYFDKSNYYNFVSFIKFDTYDKKYFPKSGFNLDVDFRWYLFSSDYEGNFNSFSQLKGKLAYAHSFFNNKLTTHIISEAGITIGDNSNEVLDYHLGGLGENFINTFVSFYGYNFGSISDEGFLLTTLKVRYELFKKNYLLGTASAARVGEDLFNSGRIFEDTMLGFGLGYGIESFLGPIELNATYSPDTSESIWYFNVGFWF